MSKKTETLVDERASTLEATQAGSGEREPIAGFAPNDMVGRRYRIVRFIARGGMGEVYEADDLELRERVALKTIAPERTGSGRSLERFRRELQLARKVTHPNVCRVFDVSFHTGARNETIAFITMELLVGETVGERLRREGPYTTAAALPIVKQMAGGLAAAHQAGIVHRDFKSPNVMLVPSPNRDEPPRVVVTDFGMARPTSTASDQHIVTAEGVMAGSPAYMAPEQVEGRDTTAAADVYAFGVVLFEMMTGTLPFLADTPFGTASMRLHQKPPSPRSRNPALDPLWDATILRCLALKPLDRFARVDEVVRALEGGDPRVRRSGGKGLLLALVAIVLGAVALLAWPRSPTPRAPAPIAMPPAEPLHAPPLLPPVPALPRVVVRSVPSGAAVLLDGRPAGTTPALLSMTLPHEVTLTLAGYRTTREVLSRAGEVTIKLTSLRPAPRPPAHKPTPPARPPGAAPTPREGLD